MKLPLHQIVVVALLSAIAFILSMIKFPIFFAPGFLSIDIADVIALSIALTIGLRLGILITIFRIVIHLFYTNSYFIGELANLSLALAFVIGFSLIYKKFKNYGVASFLSTILSSMVAIILNITVFLPLYSKFYPIEAIITLSSKLNFLVHDYTSFFLWVILPFNLIKFGLISLITILITPKLQKIFQKHIKKATN